METWLLHESVMKHDGSIVCRYCDMELPKLMPVLQTVCTCGDRLSIGRRPFAVPCCLPQ